MMNMILQSPPRMQRPHASAAHGKASPPPQGGGRVAGSNAPVNSGIGGRGGFPKVAVA